MKIKLEKTFRFIQETQEKEPVKEDDKEVQEEKYS